MQFRFFELQPKTMPEDVMRKLLDLFAIYITKLAFFDWRSRALPEDIMRKIA